MRITKTCHNCGQKKLITIKIRLCLPCLYKTFLVTNKPKKHTTLRHIDGSSYHEDHFPSEKNKIQ